MKFEDKIKAAKPTVQQIDVTEVVMQKIQKKRPVFRPAWSWALTAIIVLASMPLVASVTKALTYGYWDDYMSVMQQTGKTVSLPNGNRVITIDASLCGTYGIASTFDSAKNDKTTKREYYEIKNDSVVTDKDVVDWRKTNCEVSLAYNRIGEISKGLTVPSDKGILSSGLTVAKIQEGLLDLYLPEFHYIDPMTNEPKTIPETHYTFNQSLKDIKVIDIPSTAISATELKAGDTVTAFVAVDKALLGDNFSMCNGIAGGDACLLSDFGKTDNPGTVITLVRQPKYENSDLNSPVQLGSNVFTVVECSTSMNGLCASGEMNQNGEYTHPTPLVGWPIWQMSLLGGILVAAGVGWGVHSKLRKK